MSDAPRTIWATPYDAGITSGTYAAEDKLPKLPPNGDAARYHHDDVVRELREALSDMVAVAEQDEWDKALSGRQMIISNARAALAQMERS